MSWKTAPVGDVTTPIRGGKGGKRALASLVEQALRLQLLAQAFELRLARADAGGLDEVDDELDVAATLVERHVAVGEHLGTVLRWACRGTGAETSRSGARSRLP